MDRQAYNLEKKIPRSFLQGMTICKLQDVIFYKHYYHMQDHHGFGIGVRQARTTSEPFQNRIETPDPHLV